MKERTDAKTNELTNQDTLNNEKAYINKEPKHIETTKEIRNGNHK